MTHASALQQGAPPTVGVNRRPAVDLSLRTVENHLQHAFDKLGVASRHELDAALRL